MTDTLTDREKKAIYLRIGILAEWRKLQKLEKKRPFILDANLKKLRDHTLNVHTAMENFLEVLLSMYLIKHALQTKHDGKKLLFTMVERGFHERISPLYSRLSYTEKLKYASEQKIISPAFFQKAKAVNKIRNNFGHAITYREELNTYKKPEKYLQALKTLTSASFELEKVINEQIIK